MYQGTSYETSLKDELLDELPKNYTSPEDLMGPEGLLAELKQRLISRVLDSELTTHLGYEKHEQKAANKKNARNGHTPKTLRSDDGAHNQGSQRS